MSFDQVLEKIQSYPCNLVELTGGEPLAQPSAYTFLEFLADKGYELMLETSGAYPIQNVHNKVKIIMDLKTPSSKEAHRNLWENIQYLNIDKDEVKFVVGCQEDLDYVSQISQKYQLHEKARLLVSPVFDSINLATLATWVMDQKQPFQMQLQMHKYIWDPETQGV